MNIGLENAGYGISVPLTDLNCSALKAEDFEFVLQPAILGK